MQRRCFRCERREKQNAIIVQIRRGNFYLLLDWEARGRCDDDDHTGGGGGGGGDDDVDGAISRSRRRDGWMDGAP